MYVRVMAQNAQCSEDGPFFPTTPRYVIQNGMSIEQDILKSPDWLLIGILCLALIVTIIIIILALVLFRKYGWSKSMSLDSSYRIGTLNKSFDDYSSRGSSVHAIKKYHRNLQTLSSPDGVQLALMSNLSEGEAADTLVPVQRDDEFWDYEKQVDLEGFTAEKLYETLAGQSRHVTQTLAKQKEEAKALYQKVADQAASLKGLWSAKLNLEGRTSLATPEDLAMFERSLEELEIELERRKRLGHMYQETLSRQAQLIAHVAKQTEDHYVELDAAISEAGTLLRGYAEKLQRGQLYKKDGSFDEEQYVQTAARVGSLLENMNKETTEACKRAGAWNVLGVMAGGQIVQSGTSEAMDVKELIGPDLSLRSPNLLVNDPVTGLIRPTPGTMMRLADGSLQPIPDNYFFSPDSGRVLPIEGHVCFDPISSRLIFPVDSLSGESRYTEEPLIAFVPFPTNPETGLPVETEIKPLSRKSDMHFQASVPCSQTGLPSPLLAVTIHPLTGDILPLAGTHTDIVTGLPIAIELGSLMFAEGCDKAVPIIGVRICPNTGRVLPVGGVRATPTGFTPILPYDSYEDMFNTHPIRVHSVFMSSDGRPVPAGGGYEAFLAASALAIESRLINAHRKMAGVIFTRPAEGQSISARMEEAEMEAAQKEFHIARSKLQAVQKLAEHDLHRRNERAELLARTGGSPGMYEFFRTGQLLPILIGTKMEDPSGSGLKVPILGAEKNKNTGKIVPLGGSLEHPNGLGLVPISIGAKAIDPVTAELSSVIGVRTSPETGVVLPVTLASGGLKQRKAPLGAIAILHEEIAARKGHWRRMRQKEAEIIEAERKLTNKIMFNCEGIKVNTTKNQLVELEKLVAELEDMEKRETQRRKDAEEEFTTIVPPDVVAILMEVDHREQAMSLSHLSAHMKLPEIITRFLTKLATEDNKFKDSLAELHGASNPEAEATIRQRNKQLRTRLLAEINDQLWSREEVIHRGKAHVEFFRALAEILAYEAKELLSGASFVAGSYDCMLSGMYGELNLASGTSDQELIPLLNQLISMLESNAPFVLDARLLAVGQLNAQIAPQPEVLHHVSPSQSLIQTAATQRSAPQAAHAAGTSTLSLADSKHNSVSVIQTMVALPAAANSNGQERVKVNQQQLYEKQVFEAAKLESDLRTQEISDINAILQTYSDQKTNALAEAKRDLKARLAGLNSEQEREKILLEHSKQLAKLTDSIEMQKLAQLNRLQEQLVNRRRTEKKNLHKGHLSEAKSLGLPTDTVPVIVIPSHDELDRDIKLLAIQQQRLLAEMQENLAELEETTANINQDELLARLGKLHLSDDVVKSLRDELQDSNINIGNIKERMKARREKHRAEKISTEKNLRAEDVAELKTAVSLQEEADRNLEQEAVMDVLRDLEKERFNQLKDVEIRKRLTDADTAEKDRIISEHNEQMREMERQSRASAEAQKNRLAAKLAARKRLKEELTTEKAINDEMARIALAQAAKGDTIALDAVHELADKMASEDLVREQSLLENQVERQAELEVKYRDQEQEVNAGLETELQNATKSVSQQLDMQKKLALENHKAKFEREMVAKRRELSEQEYEKLLAAHKRELSALERNLDAEKERQKQSLQDKIEARRQQKAAQIKAKLEVDLNQELIRQRLERDGLRDDATKDTEKSVLKQHAAGKDGQQRESLIFQVLRQRHLKQAVRLEGQLQQEEATKLLGAENQVSEERQAARDELVKAMDQELLDLVTNAGSLQGPELAEKRDQLKAQHKKVLGEFDKVTADVLAEAKSEARRQLEINQAYQKLHLKEIQLKELFEAMSDLTPEQALTRQYQEESARAQEEASKYHVDVVSKIAAELEDAKRVKLQQAEERKREMEQSLRKLELELEEECRREVQREEERQAERKRLQEKQLEDRKRQEELAIANSNKTEDEKERLLAEHNDNVKRLEENLQKESERSKAALAAKLEARREKKAAAEKARLAKELQMKAEEQTVQEIQHKKQEAQADPARTQLKSMYTEPVTSNLAALTTPLKVEQKRTPTTQGPVSVMASSEKDYVALLMASPLFQQINDLQDMLDKQAGTGSTVVTGGDYSNPYIDVKDAQWRCLGNLTPADVHDISSSQFVVYRFGLFVSQMLHELVGSPEITILLASNLPPNDYTRNAYRHSFFYERARKILFIRKERLESIGEFILLIVHCLSHIATGDLGDDSQPLFLRHFYKSLKVVCQDMFFSRSKPSSPSLIGRLKDRSSLELAFRHTASVTEKTNVMAELVNIRVKGRPSDVMDESAGKPSSSYEAYSGSADLRKLLADSGGLRSSADAVSQRLAELTGQTWRAENSARSVKTEEKPIEVKSGVILEAQIQQLQNKCDAINADLLPVLELESELESELAKADRPTADSSIREKLIAVQNRKQHLMQSVSIIEQEIKRKQKDLKGMHRS